VPDCLWFFTDFLLDGEYNLFDKLTKNQYKVAAKKSLTGGRFE
jgi:hypothetical protein